MEWLEEATALNNTGVNLLQQGNVPQALQSFEWLSMSVARCDGNSCQAMVFAISQAQAHQEQSSQNDNAMVQVQPLDDTDIEQMQWAASVHSSSVVFPLRLDGSDHQDMTSAIYMTAVSLYNHGIAMQCAFANGSIPAEQLVRAEQSLRTAKMLLWHNQQKLLLPNQLREQVQSWNAVLLLVNQSLEQVVVEQELHRHLTKPQQPRHSQSHSPRPLGKTASYRKVQTRASAA